MIPYLSSFKRTLDTAVGCGSNSVRSQAHEDDKLAAAAAAAARSSTIVSVCFLFVSSGSSRRRRRPRGSASLARPMQATVLDATGTDYLEVDLLLAAGESIKSKVPPMHRNATDKL